MQEVDIPTGRVLFEWHSYPQVGIKESYSKPPKKQLGTKAVPVRLHPRQLDRRGAERQPADLRPQHACGLRGEPASTGKVLWRLGGKKSTLQAGRRASGSRGSTTRAGSRTGRSRSSTTAPRRRCTSSHACSCCGSTSSRSVSTLVRSYHHPKKLLSPVRGQRTVPAGRPRLRRLGRLAVRQRARQERTRALRRVLRTRQDSRGRTRTRYRAYRFGWHGRPTDAPDDRRRRRQGLRQLERRDDVTRWQVLLGDRERRPATATAAAKKSGFETAIPLGGDGNYVAVQALDARAGCSPCRRP